MNSFPKAARFPAGGSRTLHETGLYAALKKERYHFLDPLEAAGGEAKENIARLSLSADYYLMSCNAISVTGELVNNDGIGNRTASLLFGLKTCDYRRGNQ